MDRGRPTVKTDEIVAKIEEAAAFGASIEEIAFYADIHRSTLYRWMEEDVHLKDRIEELQERPILAARQSVVKAFPDNPDIAMKYLERKKRSEFAVKIEQDTTHNFRTYEIVRGESEDRSVSGADSPVAQTSASGMV